MRSRLGKTGAIRLPRRTVRGASGRTRRSRSPNGCSEKPQHDQKQDERRDERGEVGGGADDEQRHDDEEE